MSRKYLGLNDLKCQETEDVERIKILWKYAGVIALFMFPSLGYEWIKDTAHK